tara:strand:- start:432 stop:707 length:276 start_codon:yes stop_codon:yes gene_type:complete
MTFKMKGSPFQRNFGIGKTNSPEKTTPNKQSIAPKQADTSAFMPDKGSFADKVLKAVVPENTVTGVLGSIVKLPKVAKIGKAIYGAFKKDK